MKLRQSLSWSWAMSQTDLCLSCTTAMLYVDKDLVTANIKTGDFLSIEYSRLYSGLRLNGIFPFSKWFCCLRSTVKI